jgi:O-antigen/teichoic acid export membrane protein
VALGLLIDMRRVPGFRISDMSRSLRMPSLRQLAMECLPIAGTMFLATAYTRLDVFFIKPVAGAVALGLYSYAYRLSEPFRFVASAVEVTIYSYLSRMMAWGRKIRGLKLAGLCLAVTSYALAFSILSAALGYLVTTRIYPEYRAALHTIFVLSSALFVRCLAGFTASFLNASGLFRRVLIVASCNLVLMAAIIYPFTRKYGIEGAAISLLLVESVNAIVQGGFFAKAVSRSRRELGFVGI